MHTPGPWTQGGKGFSDQVFASHLIDPGSEDWGEGLICETGGNVENARLIAAAPELLAAAILAVSQARAGIGCNLDGLESAIAKAEGR